MNLNLKRFALTAALIALTSTAFGGKIPKVDLTTEKGVSKTAKKLGFTFEGNLKAFPKKVAIGYFQIRYTFNSPVATTSNAYETTYTTFKLQLTDEDYTRLTDMLYSDLEHALKAQGIEVVPKETVLASAAYQALEGEEGERESGRRARYAASGMKNFPTMNGQPKRDGAFAALNADLGTDAVVAVYANIGICNVIWGNKAGVAGVVPCLYTGMTFPGYSLSLIGGAKGTGEDAKPDWRWRAHKEMAVFKYDKENVYDAALFGSSAAMTPQRRKWWQAKRWDAQSEAFIAGAGEIFQTATTLAFSVFDARSEKERAEAGVVKPASLPEQEVPGAAPSVVEPEAVIPDVVTPLPGVESCYFGPVTSTSGGKTTHVFDSLVRRAVDGDTILEDSVSFTPTPTRFATKYKVDGATYTGAEATGFWTVTGKAIIEGGKWSSWDAVFTIPSASMTVKAHYELREGGLHVTTSTITAAGLELATGAQDLKPLDTASCYAKLKGVPFPKGGLLEAAAAAPAPAPEATPAPTTPEGAPAPTTPEAAPATPATPPTP